MQARANRIGGRLTVTSNPGQGTEVLVEVEIDEQEGGQTS
jgi:signal transduction histidine kinase